MLELSHQDAVRIALRAQGFGRAAGATRRQVLSVFKKLGAIQLDSVNVLIRSHYLPLYSRLGAYDRSLLDSLVYRERRLAFEYWGHQASILPIEMYPLFRWKMESGAHPRFVAWAKKNEVLVDRVYKEVAERGPVGASEISDPGSRSGPWWGWNDAKAALEWLFHRGLITTAHRRNFERIYDLTERVIPKEVLEAPVPSENDAKIKLIQIACRALGVATAKDIAFYFAMTLGRLRPLIEEAGLRPVSVEGWSEPAWTIPSPKTEAPLARGLISPFDSLVWFRDRTERLFGMKYRIEIYVPEPKRIFGYYVLPYLFDDRLVARLDLKSDRKSSALLVQGAHAETKSDSSFLDALAADLWEMARWLGLDRVEVMGRGDIARPLKSLLSPVRAAGGRKPERAARSSRSA